MLVGTLLVGIAVGFFKAAALGADPFTTMNTGISAFIGVQFGTLQLLVNAAILIFIFLWKREFIGLGTICNMVFVGYTADVLLWILKRGSIAFEAWPIRIVVLAAAVVLICLGVALYLSTDMGMAPYDALGYIAEVLTKGKLQFRVARVLFDILCVVIGFFTGMQTGIQWKIVGIGTVISALCTGPLIQFFRTHWSDRLLSPFQKQE